MKMRKLVTLGAISSYLIFGSAIMLSQQPAPAPKSATQDSTQATGQAASPAKPPITSISQVRRIYIDGFGDDVVAKQIQAMVVAELAKTERFIATENKDKADAILKGAALEKTSQELHGYNSSTAAGHASGGHSATVSGSVVNGNGSISGSSNGGFAASSAAISDSYQSTETVNDARIAVRLVNQDGDIIWATAQESHGAKYKGSSADVAEKVVKQLLRDIEKLEQKKSETTAPPSTTKTN
jgi:curli biogenesis system outer membrane secretion channel CsgG